MKATNKKLSLREYLALDKRLIELNETSKTRALNVLEKIMLRQIVNELTSEYYALNK